MAGKKKKKKGLLLILLVLLLVALGGIYAGVTIYQKQQAEKDATDKESETIPLLSLDPAKIDTISWEAPEGSMNLKYNAEEDSWMNLDEEAMPMYAGRISSLAKNICTLAANLKVEDTMANAASFGLDDPDYSFVVTDTDGVETKGFIGMQNSLNGYYYFNLEGSEDIYMISSTIPGNINHDTYYFVKCDSYEAISASTDITSFSICNEAMDTVFTKHPNGLPEVAYYGFTWYYDQDGTTKPSDPEYTSTYLETLAAITTKDCVHYHADEAELASYGITDDSYRFNIHTSVTQTVTSDAEGSTEAEEPETITVENDFSYIIGDPVDEEAAAYYVALGDTGKVFTMEAAHVHAILNARYHDFVNMEISLIAISALEALDVTAEGKDYHFHIERETVEEDGEEEVLSTYFYDGAEMEEDLFKDLYMKLIAIWGDRGITENDVLVDTEPVMTLVYHTSLEHFPTVSIELRSYDNNYYQATVNGATEVLVNKNDLIVAFNALDALNETE